MTDKKILSEIYRKSIHMSSLWMPYLYYFLAKNIMLKIMLIITFFYVLFDLGRQKFLFIQNIFKIFSSILREKENKGQLTGASYMLMSCSLVIAVFGKHEAIIAILILIISDTCAALFGKYYGKRKIFEEKTLVGSVAFTISGIAVSCLYVSFVNLPIMSYFNVVIAVLLSCCVEIFSSKWKIDDNFSIPISAAAALFLLKWMI